MNKSDEILERCFKCKSFQEDDCGIYFMMALWQKECKFFKNMKTKYQQYLEKCEIVDEDSFNKVINSFPEFDMENVDIEAVIDTDELCKAIINSILNDWRYAYCDEANFNSKTFDLEDVESLGDLEEINKYFLEKSNWTIQNYRELKEGLEEKIKTDKEKKIKKEIERLLNIIKYNATTEELAQIIEEYGYKK